MSAGFPDCSALRDARSVWVLLVENHAVVCTDRSVA